MLLHDDHSNGGGTTTSSSSNNVTADNGSDLDGGTSTTNNNNNTGGTTDTQSIQTNFLLHHQHLKQQEQAEIKRLKTQIEELQVLLAESEAMVKLHLLQEKVLKEEIRELERSTKREASDMEYVLSCHI